FAETNYKEELHTFPFCVEVEVTCFRRQYSSLFAGMAQMERRCILNCDAQQIRFGLPERADQKEKWLRFIFNSIPKQYQSDLVLCAHHFTKGCFLNWSKWSEKLQLRDGAVPTLRNPYHDPGVYEYRVKTICEVAPAVNHVASQTDPVTTETRAVGARLPIACPNSFKSTGTQVAVKRRNCGVCTETITLDSPLLLLQPGEKLKERPSKRPRLSLAEEEVVVPSESSKPNPT
ncbi:hypothetical protein CCH79_00007512, partial [Gambusia affinis]